jgi:integrase
VRGKGGRPRVVRIGHEAARAVDRYLRVRSRHGQAWRAELWLGVSNRGPMTANGIYQMIAAAAGRPGWMPGRTGSGTTSAIPGWTAAARRGT